MLPGWYYKGRFRYFQQPLLRSRFPLQDLQIRNHFYAIGAAKIFFHPPLVEDGCAQVVEYIKARRGISFVFPSRNHQGCRYRWANPTSFIFFHSCREFKPNPFSWLPSQCWQWPYNNEGVICSMWFQYQGYQKITSLLIEKGGLEINPAGDSFFMLEWVKENCSDPLVNTRFNWRYSSIRFWYFPGHSNLNNTSVIKWTSFRNIRIHI